MASTIDQFSNFATSTVAGGAGGSGTALLSTDTTLHVATGDGAKFPSAVPFSILLGTTTGSHEIAQCTAISGDALTLTRGQEGTSGQTWAVGASVAQMVTAANLAHLWATTEQTRVNVKDYGAVGDGVTDDTAAIQAAITAVQNAGGGVVWLPAVPYLVSSTLIVNADNVEIEGGGWGAQLIAKSGWSAGTYMIQVQGPGGAGNFRYGIRIAHLFLNGNNVAGVNGLDLVSTYAALLDHVRCRYIVGVAVLWDGISGAFGAYNYMRNCFITDGGSAATGIKTNNAEWLTVQGGHIGYYQGGTSVGILIQNLNCVVQGVQFDYNDIAIQVKYAGRTSIVGCQFDRGWTYFIYLNDTQNNTVSDCFFGVFEGSAAQLIFVDGSGNSGNLISGCTVEAGSGWTHFINEGSGIGGSNLYTNNHTGGLPLYLLTGVARGNRGYNPLQSLANPAAPTLGTNSTGGTLTAGTYQVKVTLVSESGETAASAATSQAISGTQELVVTSPPQQGNAYGWYAYVTQAGGSTFYRQQTAGSPSPFGGSVTYAANPTTSGATAPGSNTTTDVTTPSVPASTTPLQNTTGVDVTVYLTGGTVSAVTIGNKATGLTAGAFRLPANQAITLTYSVAPTWVWFGE